jgi:NitT/TauT family transport system ATP-binding protein
MAPRLPADTARPDIEVTSLTKVFLDSRKKTPIVAVEEASFSVNRGEFVSICGPSGCGKSTILRILAGLEKHTVGDVRIAGGGRNPAMVFQESSLFPWLSVHDNVAYGLSLRGVRRRERRERVQPLLEMTGLADWSHAYPHQLSGGMKQRASVARALANDEGDVLLMDEPFGALDEQTRVGLQQELLRIWEHERKTVVFITHSIEEALTLSDRVLVMSARPGRIIADILIPFGRPRDAIQLRREPEFGELTFRIWNLLRAERTMIAAAGDA